ncbi:type IV secretion system protein [uncultured Desulfovibrio sp.]|uniref:type IV secretion system protein n=1 Tax=uncultured Desulfovibrio sp. TaxID=167968 RepID=UPI00258A6CAE|nr:type IV secretion system protein [uncultured Desulfovibrio sp.]
MSFFKKKEKTDVPASAPKPTEGHNPYLNARQEWLERYGSYINRAAQWRLTAFIALLLLGGSIMGNVIQANQVKAIPYIIEVDKLGKAAVTTRADQASAAPLRLIQAEIAACITDWRTVTADIELQKQMIQRLSFFVAGSAKGVLKEWFTTNNPYEIAKAGKLVHVEIKSLPLPVSADSYRVEWTETVRAHSGVALENHSYEATVSVQINPPTAEAVLLRNPGGVYITSLSASRVFKAGSAPFPAQAQ